MKTIEFIKQPDGTIKLEYGEMSPKLPLCPRTVGHVFSTNQAWYHHVQIDEGYLFVKRAKGGSVAINLDHLVDLAIEAVPAISHPPVITKAPKEGDLMIESASRSKVKHKWQASEDGKQWVDLEPKPTPGETVEGHKKVRCILTNASGQTIVEPK